MAALQLLFPAFDSEADLSLLQALLNGIPISEKHLNAEDFEEAVLSEIMNQTPVFQKAVYKGEFTDGDNALDFVMNQPNVMPRYLFFFKTLSFRFLIIFVFAINRTYLANASYVYYFTYEDRTNIFRILVYFAPSMCVASVCN